MTTPDILERIDFLKARLDDIRAPAPFLFDEIKKTGVELAWLRKQLGNNDDSTHPKPS